MGGHPDLETNEGRFYKGQDTSAGGRRGGLHGRIKRPAGKKGSLRKGGRCLTR